MPVVGPHNRIYAGALAASNQARLAGECPAELVFTPAPTSTPNPDAAPPASTVAALVPPFTPRTSFTPDPRVSTAAPEAPQDTVSLRLLSYNVFNRPEPCDTSNQTCRAGHIGATLGNGDFDIVALYESNQQDDARRIAAGARKSGLLPLGLSLPNDHWYQANGGVSLLSRYPLAAPLVTREYVHASGVDRLAEKGFVYARLRINEKLCVNVIVTHTNADNVNSDGDTNGPIDVDATAVRQTQLAQIRDFYRDEVDHQWPTILMGDMNVNGIAYDDAKHPEYKAMINALTVDGDAPIDTYRSLRGPWLDPLDVDANTHTCIAEEMMPCISPIDPANAKYRARYDYAFIYAPKHTAAVAPDTRVDVVASSPEPFADNACGTRFLSDHAALSLKLSITATERRTPHHARARAHRR